MARSVINNSAEGKDTCSEENAKSTKDENGENSNEQQPPQKKKRLSNREYKKMMKGQNKVSMIRIHCIRRKNVFIS